MRGRDKRENKSEGEEKTSLDKRKRIEKVKESEDGRWGEREGESEGGWRKASQRELK